MCSRGQITYLNHKNTWKQEFSALFRVSETKFLLVMVCWGRKTHVQCGTLFFNSLIYCHAFSRLLPSAKANDFYGPASVETHEVIKVGAIDKWSKSFSSGYSESPIFFIKTKVSVNDSHSSSAGL